MQPYKPPHIPLEDVNWVISIVKVNTKLDSSPPWYSKCIYYRSKDWRGDIEIPERPLE